MMKWICILSLAIIFPLLSGCNKEAGQSAVAAEPKLSQQYRQGPVTVIVSASETNIPTSGKIQLMVDVHAPADTEVIFPEIGNLIEPFSIADGYAEPAQTLPNGKQLHRRVWILVPGLAGKAVFQSLEVQAGTRSIKTKPIAVAVESLLPQGLETLEIRDIQLPATLLPEQKKQQQRWIFVLSGLSAVIFLTLIIKLIRRPKKIIVIPPYEIAIQALENLPEDPLARLQELRSILLAVVEAAFNIPTIGKTTAEIIPAIPKFPLLGRRGPLVDFLENSDLIRFSNRMPDGYVESAEEYVRRFTDEMKKEGLCD
jgi:hypothetical protein